MNAATEFDVGPLTWVKSEIDLALERAAEALRQFTAGGDATQLKFARTHLHQVRGALAIVGLDGVTQCVDAQEGLLDDFEQQKVAADGERVALVLRAIDAVRHYLDDLVNGEPNQPLRLLPVYGEILAARGHKRVSATDLFFPDLSLRPPRRAPAPALPRDELQQLLRAQRARFQRGLLAWLRNPAERGGIAEMLDATRQVEATQELAAARAFWWVAAGMLTALAEDRLPAGVDIKQLCARIDLQIRRLIEGSQNVAERLMRDALYYVAQAEASADGLVRQIKDTYQLQSLLPAQAAAVAAPQEALRRRLRESIAATEEAWNKFCAGTAQSLPVFRDHAATMQQTVEQLGHTDYRRLAQAIASAANWLAEKPSRHSEALAMEIATAILLAQNAQENFTRLGADFAHQVDVMVARLHGFLADNPPAPGSEVPLLDEMSRQAQEKLLIGQVAKEIQSNLAQIEQVLDGFFRDADKRGDLAGLDGPLHQIVGALMIMGQNAAVDTLHECEGEIRRFAAADYVPQEGDFERVADRLSALGFFIDAMQHGATDFAEFTRSMSAPPPAAAEEEAAAGSVEQELEQAKRETQALLIALKEQPADEGLRQELKQNLETLKQDADLVADSALGQQAKAALSALDAGGAPAVDEALAGLRPQTAAAPTPSAETLQLAQADEEDLDAELLAIFIEEAKEVLQAVAGNLTLLQEQPHNVEVLTNIRRSFHTLKGSGRMVGLRELGEVAWGIEQVLNLWLRQELEVTQPVFELVSEGQRVFTAWVAHLEERSLPLPDAGPLVALADALRVGGEVPPTPVPAASEPPAEALPAATGDEETYDEAATTVVLGNFGAAEAAPPPAEPLEIIDIAPIDLGDIPFAEAPVEAATVPEEVVLPELPAELPAEPPSATVVVGHFGQRTPEPEADAADREPSLPADEPLVIDLLPPEPVATVPTLPAEEFVLPELADEAPLAEVIELAMPAAEAEPGVELPAPAEVPPAERGASLGISATLFDIFLEEARSHIATLNREFASFAADPTQPTPYPMARAAHTLAGISGTVGLAVINRLGATLEHALLRRETTDHPESIAGVEVVRQTIAALEEMVVGVADERLPEANPQLIDALDQLYPPPAALVLGEELIDAAPPAPTPATPEAPAEPAPAAAAVPGAIVTPLAGVKDELDEQLLPIFLEEAFELIGGINEQLRQWRAAPGDHETLRALHRLFHTLKGSARMAGAMTLGEITHAIESRVEQADKAGSAPPELIDDVESAFDSVVQIVERLQRGESLEAPPVAAADASPELASAVALAEEAAPALPVTVVEAAGVAAAPSVEAGGEEAAAQKATLRVRADLIDQLVNEAGELSIARARIEGEMVSLKGSLLDLTENVIRLRRQLRDIEIQAETQMQSRIAQTDEKHAGFDPLEFDRFTRFQELTRMMAESVNDVATVQQNLLKNLDDANAAILAQARMNRQLQQELMSVRMVPFASQADRLYRIVRQTAKELGKRANLEIRGGQVELDRSVLDKIGAPLEHLLRNAVAHGLEGREARLAAGKTEIGEVTLTLAQEGNEIILSMADDGAGLDFARIRARGIEAGLLAADEEADEGRLIKLIFTPGFSTAAEVSQIAGRGVGMDVVKTEIGALGGRIEVNSLPGKGCTFRLYIPLTLAVTQALLVRAGSHLYAIPSSMIEQVLELKETFLARIREAGEAEWLGNRYPYRFLPHLLGDTGALPEARRQYWVLLLRSGAQRVAVQVDELRGNREIVVKNIGPQLARVVGIDGATVLGDGQVVLILNPVALASRARAAHLPEVAPTALQAPDEHKATAATLPTVMVVDDSLTVRKITGRLLSREGYQVLTAKDGVDALEQMLDIIPDVLLVDIEMPRMDGFDLTRNVRADEKLKDVPIIMITSRTADKHRNYAFEIGVNNYLGKPYQEDELLRLVGDYTRAKRQH
ncbi:Hpt domain-containing protein [Azospira restricta]|uniref:Chemotaxis protein CheA n=1 Tax=Azospira restricta TaxID=404405 RepID=A0A974SPR6_9RHOO|nr:Hpt domain-containing protein [Azospira restricta]QRJ64238.1 Hpt domain-containing protein [Azospira restricta]